MFTISAKAKTFSDTLGNVEDSCFYCAMKCYLNKHDSYKMCMSLHRTIFEVSQDEIKLHFAKTTTKTKKINTRKQINKENKQNKKYSFLLHDHPVRLS